MDANPPQPPIPLNGACLWFSQPAEIPGEPTLNDARWRTYNVNVSSGRDDWTRKNPWRAPGTAPIIGSGCGSAGGGPVMATNGGWGPTGTPQGFDAAQYPASTSPTVWVPGSVEEVAWGLWSNHGGGYSWRLCPAHGTVSEECFQQQVLRFAGDTQFLQHRNGSRWEIPSVKVSHGTFPLGSEWIRVPYPGCAGYDVSKNSSQGFTNECDETQFPEPLPGLHGFGYSPNPVHDHNIIDRVIVPDVPNGDYLLSWRWDAEQTDQVWQNCADVRISDLEANSFAISDSREKVPSLEAAQVPEFPPRPNQAMHNAQAIAYVVDYHFDGVVSACPVEGGACAAFGSGWIQPQSVAALGDMVYVIDRLGAFNYRVLACPTGIGREAVGTACTPLGQNWTQPMSIAAQAQTVYVSDFTGNEVKACPSTGGNCITLGNGNERWVGPQSVAAAGSIVVVADLDAALVKMCPAAGGPCSTLGDSWTEAWSIAATEQMAFVTDVSSCAESRGAVMACRLDAPGNAKCTEVGSDWVIPTAIAAAGNTVYVVDQGDAGSRPSVRACPVDFAAPCTHLGTEWVRPLAIAVAGQTVVVADRDAPTVRACRVDGGGCTALGRGWGAPSSIAIGAAPRSIVFA